MLFWLKFRLNYRILEHLVDWSNLELSENGVNLSVKTWIVGEEDI